MGTAVQLANSAASSRHTNKKMLTLTVTLLVLAVAHTALGANQPIEVTGGGGSTKIDWSKFEYQNLYCVGAKKECPGGNLEGEQVFGATARQCQTACNRKINCLSVYYGADKYCYFKR